MEITLNVKECNNGEVWKVLQLIDKYSISQNSVRVKEGEVLIIDFNLKKTFGSTKRTKAIFDRKMKKVFRTNES